MNKSKYSLGIDIGGTKTAIGLIDAGGKIAASIILKTNKYISCKETVRDICKQVKILVEKESVALDTLVSIGVGIPGTVDMVNGIVVFCTNLPWKNETIKNYFSEFLGKDVILMQDTWAGAIAEKQIGYGKDFNDFVFVAIGTGISCGIILNGRLYTGGKETAGELGEMVMIPNGLPCPCGHNGCLERYCSGSGIQEIARIRYKKELSTLEIFDLARLGDYEAKKIIAEGIEILALGISHVASILSPQAIVVSGGMCKELELFINPLQDLINKYSYKLWVQRNPQNIFVSRLGQYAPMIGAGLLYKEAV